MAKASVAKPAAVKTASKSESTSQQDGSADDIKTLPGIFVRSFAPSFRRAGFTFTQEGFGLLIQDLSEAQLEAIRGEPLLHVQESEFPATEGEDARMGEQDADGGAKSDATNGGVQSETGNA